MGSFVRLVTDGGAIGVIRFIDSNRLPLINGFANAENLANVEDFANAEKPQ
jgi:hypothetical protein